MIAFVEVDRAHMTDPVRHAIVVAAARKFLTDENQRTFLREHLGEWSSDVDAMADSVDFTEPLLQHWVAVEESEYHRGVVVVPFGDFDPVTQTQRLYAAWLVN